MSVSADLHSRAGGTCTYCGKKVRRQAAIGVSYGDPPRISHTSCAQRAAKVRTS